jgi:uncharacterized membrane protein (UPF0127 family)
MIHDYVLGSFTISLGVGLLSCSILTAENPAPQPVLETAPVEFTQPSSPPAATYAQGVPTAAQSLPITAQVTIADQVIQLEVANTPEKQATGLMFRTEMPDDRGMLFPFEAPRMARFWMRNVPIALDMIFLRDGEVVAIAADVPPCTTPTCPTYGPATLVDQVLELRGGRAAELGLQTGDRLAIEYLSPDEGKALP